MSRSTELAWAAGFFDGEGSIGTPGRLYVALGISQVARGPISKFEELFGGKVYAHHRSNPRHSDAWRWVLTGRPAADALGGMLPYLLLKVNEARWAIELARLVPEYDGAGKKGRWSTKRMPEALRVRRMELANLIRARHRDERLPQRL